MKELIVSGERCMTVGELIAHLQTFPPDVPVVYRACSDYWALQAHTIQYRSEESKTAVIRNGCVCETFPAAQWGTEVPEYVGVVMFPGN